MTISDEALAYYATLVSPEQARAILWELAEGLVRHDRRQAAVAAERVASGLAEGDTVQVKAGWERGRTATITGVNTQTGAWTVALDSGMPGTYFSADIEKVAAPVEAAA